MALFQSMLVSGPSSIDKDRQSTAVECPAPAPHVQLRASKPSPFRNKASSSSAAPKQHAQQSRHLCPCTSGHSYALFRFAACSETEEKTRSCQTQAPELTSAMDDKRQMSSNQHCSRWRQDTCGHSTTKRRAQHQQWQHWQQWRLL